MGALGGSVLLLVVLLVRAEEEPFLGQREVTFDLSDLEDEGLQKPVLQKPLRDFHESEITVRRIVVPDIPDMMRSYPAGPPMFGPRSMGPPQIPFPLARPNINNIQAICRYSKQRPRYPKETLPSNGFGYLVRRANAINQLESWFSVCCSSGTENEGLLLCCAEQAWKKSLSAFCNEEFMVKTSHYHCCKQTGSKRISCFEKESPLPLQSYMPSDHELGSWADFPSMDEGFNFDPSTCHKQSRSLIAPRATRGKIPNVVFPPGRPNSDNIESICTNHKHRWWYLSKCLLRKASGGMAYQAKAINALEKGFGQCCKKRKEKQSCAEMKWKTMVDDFCKDEVKADVKCCEKEKGEEQYNCFAAEATNPGYTPNNDSASLYRARPSLDTFCDMYRTYSRTQRAVEMWHFIANKMSAQCCSSMEKKNSACFQMDSDVELLCRDPLWQNFSCCKQKGRSKCFTKHVLHKLAEDMGVNRSHRKKCKILPLIVESLS